MDRVRAALDDVATRPVWTLGPRETAGLIGDLVRSENRVAALRLRALAHADRVGVANLVGATSTANWYSHTQLVTRRQAHRECRLTKALDSDQHDPTRAALDRGSLLLDQASVVVDAVDLLPDSVGAEERVDAETYLVQQAQHFDAITLRRLGKQPAPDGKIRFHLRT